MKICRAAVLGVIPAAVVMGLSLAACGSSSSHPAAAPAASTSKPAQPTKAPAASAPAPTTAAPASSAAAAAIPPVPAGATIAPGWGPKVQDGQTIYIACGNGNSYEYNSQLNQSWFINDKSGSPCNRAPAAPATTPAAAVPQLTVKSYSGTRPSIIGFSGDATYIVTGLTWNWGATEATGTGTSIIEGCNPNCATGSQTKVTDTIVLSNVQGGQFTAFTSTRDGTTSSGPVSEIMYAQ